MERENKCSRGSTVAAFVDVTTFKLTTPRSVGKVLYVRYRPAERRIVVPNGIVELVDCPVDDNDGRSSCEVKRRQVSMKEVELLAAALVSLKAEAWIAQGLGDWLSGT